MIMHVKKDSSIGYKAMMYSKRRMLIDLTVELTHIGGSRNRKNSKLLTPITVNTAVVKVDPNKQVLATRTAGLILMAQINNWL